MVAFELKRGQLWQFTHDYIDVKAAGHFLGIDPDIPEYAEGVEPMDGLLYRCGGKRRTEINGGNPENKRRGCDAIAYYVQLDNPGGFLGGRTGAQDEQR